MCSGACKQNQPAIFCDLCETWVHLKCAEITKDQFESYGKSNQQYYCPDCYVDIFPFQNAVGDDFYENVVNNNCNVNCNVRDRLAKISGLNKNIRWIGMEDSQYCTIENIKFIDKNCKFTMLSVNIRSLNANIDKLNELLVSFDLLPDIIALSETKLNLGQVNYPDLTGYNFFHKGTTTSWGGVGLFVKKHLSISMCSDIELNIQNCEDMWVEIDLNGNKKCIIGVVYRHPKQNISEFHDSFEKLLDKLNKTKSIYYIAGDFNIDLIKCDSIKSTQSFLNMTYSLGCIPLITHPTRITSNSATLIDHVYTNNITDLGKSFILITDVSDHFSVVVCSDLNIPKHSKTVSYIRDTNNFDMDQFLQDLSQELRPLREVETDDLDIHTETFLSIFKNTLNIHAPLRKRSRKEQKLHSKPWITNGILKSIQNKNRLFKKCIKSNDKKDWDEYKSYRNQLTHIKQNAKKLYYQKLINTNKNNTALLWKTINNIINSKQLKFNTIPSKMYANTTDKDCAQGPKAISNLFNKYFTNVGIKLASKIKKPDNSNLPTSLIANNCKSFFLEPIGIEEIISHIRKLDPSKSTGLDGIPIKYVKMSTLIIAPVLTNIYNNCIIKGYFPKILKIAEIIPIHKKGSKDICSNYRPISILNPFAKLFEKCLHEQLNKYFEVNKLFSPNQYGFKKNCSTADAVLDIYNQLLDNLDKNLITSSVFLDIAKAYDTIDHDILIQKLEIYGVRGVPLELMQSYLTERKQYTVVNNVKSNQDRVVCGIPQGSTLGPLLFNIYINDLPLVSKSTIHLFADDTNLTCSHTNLQTLQQMVNEELKSINNWMRLNKLSLNSDKTEYMLVTNKKNVKSMKVVMDGKEIKRKSCIKYLGVIMDDKLSWKQQIQKQCCNLARGSGAMCRIKYYVNQQTLRMVYFALIYSHLQYCISSWGSASQSIIQPLNILQKRCIRILMGSGYRDHTNPLFFQSKCLKVNDIYKFELAKVMYKITNNMLSQTHDKLKFIEICHKHNTRQRENQNYFVPRTRTKYGQKSLQFSGIKLWNKISSKIRNMEFIKFKKEMKSQMIENYR